MGAVEALKAQGYDTDNVQFGQSWEDFLKEIPDHSTVVVCSVDFFPCLMELLSTLAQLHPRGIRKSTHVGQKARQACRIQKPLAEKLKS